jgi:hypothetical protein
MGMNAQDKAEVRALEKKLTLLYKDGAISKGTHTLDLIESTERRIGWILAGRPTE